MEDKPTQNLKNLSVTVAIPTCYGNISLIKTVESIRASIETPIEHIIVIADRTEVSPQIRDRLLEFGVEFYWNDTPGSYGKKVMQMLRMCVTDIFILTCDDIIFDKKAVAEIKKTFHSDTSVTLVASTVRPLLPSKTFIEGVLGQNVRIPGRISRLWNSGDNYLAASGRCMSFRTEHMRKFRDFTNILSSDAYFYFENRRLGGRMRLSEDSTVFNRPPQSVRDQIGPSSRYQISEQDITPFFDFDISTDYKIPMVTAWRVVLSELFQRPIKTTLYLCIFIYTRLHRQPIEKTSQLLWDTEVSTKNI